MLDVAYSVLCCVLQCSSVMPASDSEDGLERARRECGGDDDLDLDEDDLDVQPARRSNWRHRKKANSDHHLKLMKAAVEDIRCELVH